MSKYSPLKEFLERSNKETVVLTFREIEEIIGSSLPPSAYKWRVWWSNNSSFPQARNGWLAAGYRVVYVSIGDGIVRFAKNKAQKTRAEIAARGTNVGVAKKLSCREAVKKAIMELGGGPVDAEELFLRVKSMGNWSDDTIWQHLMALVVNLPPAYRHYSESREKFLFLREDGRYEIYDPAKHGIYYEGRRITSQKNKRNELMLKKYAELITTLNHLIIEFINTTPISITEVTTKYLGKPGVYVFISDDGVEYIGSTNDLFRRLKHDLWNALGQLQQPHTYGRKILSKYDNKEKARNYLRNLKLKIIETQDLGTARILEQILIHILEPKYNEL